MFFRFAPICSLLAAFAHAGWCSAETTDKQAFQVRVPGAISITAENNSANITHDLRERDQRFDWQTWTVRNQNPQGAIVTFQTDQAFTNSLDSNSKRNVELRLRRRRSPGWRITQNRDQTNYAASDETATVTAESNRAGGAELQLRVIFIEESLDTLKSGDYELVITGTLAPK